MSNTTTETEDINLRSEEVQEIMGRVPSWIERWGLLTITALLTVVLVGTAFFPYPDTLTGRFTFIPMDKASGKQPACFALLPIHGIGKVQKGQSVKVKIENYPDSEFGYLVGEVRCIANVPNEVGLYKVVINFNDMTTSTGFIIPTHIHMEGTAEIVVAEKRMIEKLKILRIGS